MQENLQKERFKCSYSPMNSSQINQWMDEYHNENLLLKKTISELYEELQASKNYEKELEEAITSINDELEEKQNTITKQLGEIERLNSVVVELNDYILELHTNKTDIKDSKSDISEEEVVRMMEEAIQLYDKSKHLHERMRDYEDKLNNKESELIELKVTISQLNLDLQKKDQDIHSLQIALEEYKNKAQHNNELQKEGNHAGSIGNNVVLTPLLETNNSAKRKDDSLTIEVPSSSHNNHNLDKVNGVSSKPNHQNQQEQGNKLDSDDDMHSPDYQTVKINRDLTQHGSHGKRNHMQDPRNKTRMMTSKARDNKIEHDPDWREKDSRRLNIFEDSNQDLMFSSLKNSNRFLPQNHSNNSTQQSNNSSNRQATRNRYLILRAKDNPAQEHNGVNEFHFDANIENTISPLNSPDRNQLVDYTASLPMPPPPPLFSKQSNQDGMKLAGRHGRS